MNNSIRYYCKFNNNNLSIKLLIYLHFTFYKIKIIYYCYIKKNKYQF